MLAKSKSTIIILLDRGSGRSRVLDSIGGNLKTVFMIAIAVVMTFPIIVMAIVITFQIFVITTVMAIVKMIKLVTIAVAVERTF